MTGGSDLAEGRDSSPSLLSRLWFRLRLLFRWIARLFGAAPPAESVAPADPEAFAFERSPEGPPFNDVNHPILRTLRRRALNDLFEWLDLDFVPGQLLERSDHSADPIAAFTTFLRSVGCDPEAVRRRDPEELSRLRDVVDLLMAFGSLTRWLQPAQRDALQLLLLSGDFPRLRRAAERLFSLSAILDAHEAQGAAPVLAGYDALAGRVRASLSRLLDLSRNDVEDAEDAAARWLRLARRRVLLDREIATAVSALDRAIASAPDAPGRRQRRDALVERQRTIESSLSLDPGLEPDAVAALLDELDGLLESLSALRSETEAEAEAASRFRSEAATDRLYRSEREEALLFFGLAADAQPTAEQIQAAWRRYMKDNHPDLTTDPDEKNRRDRLCAEANLKRHLLIRDLAA